MPELLGDFGCIKATASAGPNRISLKQTQNCRKLLILEMRKESPVTGSSLQIPRCSYLAKSFKIAPACHSNRLQSTNTWTRPFQLAAKGTHRIQTTVLDPTRGTFIQAPRTTLGCTRQWGQMDIFNSTLGCWMLSHTGPLTSSFSPCHMD